MLPLTVCNFNTILMPKALTLHSQSRSIHTLVLCSYDGAKGQPSRQRYVPSSVLLQDLESPSPDGLMTPQACPRGKLCPPTATTAQHRSGAQLPSTPTHTFLHEGLCLLHLPSVFHPDWQKTSPPRSCHRTMGGR